MPKPETAFEIAQSVRTGARKAVDVVTAALARIDADNPRINAFTAITRDTALQAAARLDAQVAKGVEPGPLAGVPFAVKNNFDVAGLTTLAGSKVYQGRPAATADSFAVRALKDAGGILVGALNMDEFACGITTENAHYGPTRNPRDPERISGGSSGGAAAAVAAGMVPLTVGTDTGGSIRVPSSMCGVFGLKPTYGRLSRGGVVPFSWSMDHVGPLANSLRDLAAGYDALQGRDPDDPVQRVRDVESTAAAVAAGPGKLRVALLEGWFADNAGEEARACLDEAAARLRVTRRVTLEHTNVARGAMNLIVMSEAGSFLLPHLRERAADFDPLTRNRLLAGAMLPAGYVAAAQRFRAWYRQQAARLFETVDVLIAPALPFPATRIGQDRIVFNGKDIPCRPMFTLLTAPLSFIGLPVVVVPVLRKDGMPLGVQVIARPFAEADAFRVAAGLAEAVS